MPRVVRLHGVRRRGEHVVEGVGEHPVLLRHETEVVDPRRDLVRAPELGDLDLVRNVVIGRVVLQFVGVLRRVRRELAADELEILGVRTVGVGDSPVPAREAGAVRDGRSQALRRLARDLGHRHALQDQVRAGHHVGIGVDLVRRLDSDREAVRFEEWNEQVCGLDGEMPVPSASDDERLTCLHARSLRAYLVSIATRLPGAGWGRIDTWSRMSGHADPSGEFRVCRLCSRPRRSVSPDMRCCFRPRRSGRAAAARMRAVPASSTRC